jgi:3-isopropylmalate dehydrogenase
MRILVLPGDGIGPEITAATMAVLERLNAAQGLGLTFEHDIVGFASLERYGSTFRDELAERFTSYEGVILGPNDGARYPPRDQGGWNYSGLVRTRYDLYANLRPARTPPGLPGKAGAFDLVIAREVTEGFYADRNMHLGNAELMPDPDTVISLRKVTRRACERIARSAFELAMTRRRRVTAVHKANVLKLGDGLFMDAVRTVAREFPEVVLDDFHIDAMAALVVRDPARFDVIVTTNMYGDILSDLASELSGSLGLAAGLLAGDRQAAAQAQHGAAPDIAGQDRANPSSLILSAALLLEWLGARHGRAELARAGGAVRDAVDRVVADPATRTADLGGTTGTRAFGEAVAAALG